MSELFCLLEYKVRNPTDKMSSWMWFLCVRVKCSPGEIYCLTLLNFI